MLKKTLTGNRLLKPLPKVNHLRDVTLFLVPAMYAIGLYTQAAGILLQTIGAAQQPTSSQMP
jgi:hypothetical protein